VLYCSPIPTPGDWAIVQPHFHAWGLGYSADEAIVLWGVICGEMLEILKGKITTMF
jgi:hypothetical protein